MAVRQILPQVLPNIFLRTFTKIKNKTTSYNEEEEVVPLNHHDDPIYALLDPILNNDYKCQDTKECSSPWSSRTCSGTWSTASTGLTDLRPSGKRSSSSSSTSAPSRSRRKIPLQRFCQFLELFEKLQIFEYL